MNTLPSPLSKHLRPWRTSCIPQCQQSTTRHSSWSNKLSAVFFSKKCRSMFCVKIVHGHFAQKGHGQFSHTTSYSSSQNILNVTINSAGMSGQGPALQGRAWEKWYVYVEGPTSPKLDSLVTIFYCFFTGMDIRGRWVGTLEIDLFETSKQNSQNKMFQKTNVTGRWVVPWLQM